MYHLLYQELQESVQQVTLHWHECVIHPFFRHLSGEERAKTKTTLKKIEGCLRAVAKKGKAFADCDRSWRHVGFFDGTQHGFFDGTKRGEVYCFDLGDMGDLNKEDEDARRRRSQSVFGVDHIS